LDALSHARAAVPGRGREGQRESRVLRVGRPLQYVRPGQERADRANERQRIADGGGRRQDCRHPRAVSDGLLHEERRRAHRRPEGRLEGPRALDDLRHAHQFPQRGRHAEPAEGLQAADAAEPARFMKTLFAAASMVIGAIAQAADITVLATPGIKEAYVELAPQFEKANQHKVTTTWAGT